MIYIGKGDTPHLYEDPDGGLSLCERAISNTTTGVVYSNKARAICPSCKATARCWRREGWRG